jgi:hypothetical protein
MNQIFSLKIPIPFQYSKKVLKKPISTTSGQDMNNFIFNDISRYLKISDLILTSWEGNIAIYIK